MGRGIARRPLDSRSCPEFAHEEAEKNQDAHDSGAQLDLDPIVRWRPEPPFWHCLLSEIHLIDCRKFPTGGRGADSPGAALEEACKTFAARNAQSAETVAA
jgi:hypothetical protein